MPSPAALTQLKNVNCYAEERAMALMRELYRTQELYIGQARDFLGIYINQNQNNKTNAPHITYTTARDNTVNETDCNIVSGVNGLAQALHIGKTKAAQIASSGILEQNRIGYYAGNKHLYHKDRLLRFIEEPPKTPYSTFMLTP